jgi:hypothetical protein
MKTIYRFVSIIFFALLLTGFLSVPTANAEEGSCYLKATNKDVFVIVFDLDRDGNQGPKIWQGRINQGESVKITTPHGLFRYDYNAEPDQDQPLSGGNDRECNNLEIILVP